MKAKRTALRLVMITVLAWSAVSVTVAQAGSVTAGSYPATLTGTDLNTIHGNLARFTFGNGARYFECATATLSATITGPTTLVKVTPSFGGCFSNGLTSVPVTVTMNSCHYNIHPTSEITAWISFDCTTASEQIEIHTYENSTKHKENKPICTHDIPQQGPVGLIEIFPRNLGTATEGFLLDFNELAKFNAINTTPGPLSVCGAAVHKFTTGSLRGEYAFVGSSFGTHTPIMVE